jgi:sulfur carrier protein ThiS
MEMSHGSTVHDVLQRLGVPPSLERVILVNGADAAPDHLLADADVIDVFPPLAGGG